MITKNDLKYYSSLLKKKFRIKEKKFIIEGKKIVEEGLKSKYKCAVILMTKDFAESDKSFTEKITGTNIKAEILRTVDFYKISDTKSPQGIAAVFNYDNFLHKNFSEIKSDLVVGLENINDPGNMGTIIRTCDWFNVNEILISNDSVELFNPKVVRSSMGSLFHLNFFSDIDIKTEIKLLKEKNYHLVCADTQGNNLYEYNFPDRTVLFFCNEANGPGEILLDSIDEKIAIPKFGQAESLNVSSAVAAILSEYKRKKGSR
jgi:RNA methyltransferase, TrmH family